MDHNIYPTRAGRVSDLQFTQKVHLSHRISRTNTPFHTLIKLGLECTIAQLFSFILHVLIPNGAYKGQKLTRLVSTNTTDKTSRTRPTMPVRMLVKYKVPMISAITILSTRSVFPMFFFIIVFFSLIYTEPGERCP